MGKKPRACEHLETEDVDRFKEGHMGRVNWEAVTACGKNRFACCRFACYHYIIRYMIPYLSEQVVKLLEFIVRALQASGIHMHLWKSRRSKLACHRFNSFQASSSACTYTRVFQSIEKHGNYPVRKVSRMNQNISLRKEGDMRDIK
jgi:hypothetical protein